METNQKLSVNELTEFLPPQENKYKRILLDPGTMAEKRIAIFVESLNDPLVLPELRYESAPVRPTGFSEMYDTYKNESDQKLKSEMWKRIIREFPGYVKACNDRTSQNDSNHFFLSEMLAAFEAADMTAHAVRTRELLREFEAE